MHLQKISSRKFPAENFQQKISSYFQHSQITICNFKYGKKLSFLRASFGDLLLNKKQKKLFVSLNDEVTEMWHLLLVVQSDTSFIMRIITLISCFCLISTSK